MNTLEPFRKLIPEFIDPFRVMKEIGSGGNGAVYLAERIAQFEQRVAIKFLYPELFSADDAPDETAEPSHVSELAHPGIVGYLDSGVTASGLRYLVMEYVDGDVIDVYCDEHRLSVAQRIDVMCDVLEALEYAHRRLVIHADLKPDNIRVTSSGRPRLLDFSASILFVGSSMSELEDNASESLAESTRHTPLYASPEQRRGERLTVASDIYSAGQLLREILVGIKPVALKQVAGNPSQPIPVTKALANLDRAKIEAIARNRGTTQEGLRKALGPDIDAFFARALQPDPADRYESAQEMRNELVRFRQGYPLRTRPVGPLKRAYKWALRNRLAAGFAVGFLVAVILSVVGVAWRTAQANRQRGIAQDRLHELVRLTDSLAGELIGSVQGLQGADTAQDALLKNAHETIHVLTAEGDPQLQLELARELQKLARLELAHAPNNPAARQVAQDDINQAGRLLTRLDRNDSEGNRLRRDNEALARSLNEPAKGENAH